MQGNADFIVQLQRKNHPSVVSVVNWSSHFPQRLAVVTPPENRPLLPGIRSGEARARLFLSFSAMAFDTGVPVYILCQVLCRMRFVRVEWMVPRWRHQQVVARAG
jgi:hypothetical protein